jgi:hypothetical protein
MAFLNANVISRRNLIKTDTADTGPVDGPTIPPGYTMYDTV